MVFDISIGTAFREEERDTRLPTIPAHPISYGDAEHLLRSKEGGIAPDDWQGDIPSVPTIVSSVQSVSDLAP